MEQTDLYKVLMQNIENSVLKGEPKDPNMQWSLNRKLIRTSTADPKPTPLKPSPNPSPPPCVHSLIQEICKQSSESLQVQLAAL